MSIAFAFRDGNRFWVATNSNSARSGINIPNEYPPTMPLFKVNDVLICYHGDYGLDEDITLKLDFAKIKSPLSEHELFRDFFQPMVALANQDSLTTKEDDKTIRSYGSSFLFLTAQSGFSFRGSALQKINQYSFMGTAIEAACGPFNWFSEKLKPADLVVEVVKGAIRFSGDTIYPILLACTDSDEMTVIEENGARHQIRIPAWEKGMRK
jgi:hypothetical protein